MPNRRVRATTRAGREFAPDPIPDMPVSVPELAERVLRTAVREYLAGHRTDATRTATAAQRAEYQQALYEHYQTVHAYIRATKETTHHVHP